MGRGRGIVMCARVVRRRMGSLWQRASRRLAPLPHVNPLIGVWAWSPTCGTGGLRAERGSPTLRYGPPYHPINESDRCHWLSIWHASEAPLKLSPVASDARAKRVIPNGVWCNWQHSGFWFSHSRFESWYPSDLKRQFQSRPPSSSGLGRRPLTALTPVQIRLGVPRTSSPLRWRGFCLPRCRGFSCALQKTLLTVTQCLTL